MSSRILRPDGWPRPKGYSDGVAATGTTVFTAGQIGWDPLTGGFVSDDFAEQTATALDNVLAIVAAAGGTSRDVVRLVWYVTRLDEYRGARARLGEVFRARFGDHYPAMSVLEVSGLLEPQAKVEIEATAVVSAAEETQED